MGEWIPLLSAEARIRLVTTPGQGKNADIVLELAPMNHTGPEPGLIYRAIIPWQQLVPWGKAINTEIRQAILDGREVVEGTNYAPVLLELLAKGQRHATAHFRLMLTADDCETIAHVIAEVASLATTKR